MNMNMIDIAKEVFEIESQQIKNLSNYLTEDFEKIVKLIYSSKSKVIVSGMGKSGIIGKKIAATLASTGTPSFFLHPGEAYHGDLGMIEKNDIVLLISNSGETDEILKLIPFLKSQKNLTISMSGNPISTLGLNTDFHLNTKVEKEACPLSLAPTSSTTATLVMGDAIAIALMKLRNFKDENFAQFHPGGSLGKRLLTKVSDVMRTDNLPICITNELAMDVVHKITKGECGLVVVYDGKKIKGIITDGDIRRHMEEKKNVFFSLTAKDLMSTQPKTINYHSKLVEATEYMNLNNINVLLVTDDSEKFIGIVKLHDTGV